MEIIRVLSCSHKTHIPTLQSPTTLFHFFFFACFDIKASIVTFFTVSRMKYKTTDIDWIADEN